MATCNWCEKEMMDLSVSTCTGNEIVPFPDGRELPAVPYDADGSYNGRCHDCNIADGGFHHPGCDMEVCPKCQGQLISCGCLDEEEDDGDDDFDTYFYNVTMKGL